MVDNTIQYNTIHWKLIAFFLMMLTVCPAVSFAQVDDWDGTAEIWTYGSGTETDPYLIESAENLAWIAEMVNAGISTFANTFFKLTIDLNMNNVAWVPIGNSTTNLFCGNFDGGGHFIDNISVSGSYTYVGLWGITGANVVVCNVGARVSFSGTATYSGGIVGYIAGANSRIENCSHTGNISSTSYSGGVVGYINGGNTEVMGCRNTGSISSTYTSSSSSNLHTGGIVAYVRGANVRIENCNNTGNVSATVTSSYYDSEARSGGIIGYCHQSIDLIRCYNNGRVSANATISEASFNYHCYSYAGGIVGLGQSSSAITMSMCYNKGVISATSHTYSSDSPRASYSGGLVGNGYTQISYSYNRGSVSAYAHYATNNVSRGTRQAGGLVGNVSHASSSFSNSYSTGTLTGETKGGIRGNATGTVTNCYYLESCGGTVSGGTSKSEASMKSSSFPILLNNNGPVFIMDTDPNVNGGYPIFGSSVCAPFTLNASDIGFTSATLNGDYVQQEYWPGGDADVVGFEYKQLTATNYFTVNTDTVTLTSYHLMDLQSGTTYNYRFFVQKDGVTYYGDVVSFTTLSCDLQVSVTPSVSEMCDGDSAVFTALCSSGHSDCFTYRWNNGVTGNILQVSDGAVYTVTVQDTNGCSATVSASVTIIPLPQGSINGSIFLCAGHSTTLYVSESGIYQWSTGANTSSITVSQPGIYSVTVTNAQGCSATASTYVTVNELPTITISGNTAVCQGNTTTLTANGAVSYQWSNGVNGATNTIGEFGNYTVTGTSAAGCSSTATTTVIVYSLPVINITGNTEICQGSTATLTANGAETYLWNNGTTDATLTTSNAGTYTVIGTDEHGCYSTESVVVVVNYPANEDIYVSESGSYEWHDNTYTESGDYTWTGQTIHGCDSVVTLHLTITPTDTTGITTYDGSDLTLYPNPTTDIATIRLSAETCNLTTEIRVYDVYGRMLSVVVGVNDYSPLRTVQIDLSNYATGIYLVKLVNGGRVVATGKLVKQ